MTYYVSCFCKLYTELLSGYDEGGQRNIGHNMKAMMLQIDAAGLMIDEH